MKLWLHVPGTHPAPSPAAPSLPPHPRLTLSREPGARRSSSRHSTSPSRSALCRKPSGSDGVFFGDSSTPSAISQVTFCSAGVIAGRGRGWGRGAEPGAGLEAAFGCGTGSRLRARPHPRSRAVNPPSLPPQCWSGGSAKLAPSPPTLAPCPHLPFPPSPPRILLHARQILVRHALGTCRHQISKYPELEGLRYRKRLGCWDFILWSAGGRGMLLSMCIQPYQSIGRMKSSFPRSEKERFEGTASRRKD